MTFNGSDLRSRIPRFEPENRRVNQAETEIVEVITHLAFYTGWPRARSAVRVAKVVFEK